ncbi:MAG: single-stranded DNA-binding protein [Anaerolineales bacterium]
MYEFNQVTFTGNIGTDPELKSSTKENGTSFMKFRFAVSRGQDITDWYSVKVFGAKAERIDENKAIQKGDRTLISGRLELEQGSDGKMYPTIVLEQYQRLRRKEKEVEAAAAEEEIPA